MNNSNFYMLDLHTTTAGHRNFKAFQRERRRLTTFSRKNDITIYELVNSEPFVLNKEDAMLLKLAGFVISTDITCIDDMVSEIVEHDRIDAVDNEKWRTGDRYIDMISDIK